MFVEHLLHVSTVLRADGAGINKMSNILAFLLGDPSKEWMMSTFTRWQMEMAVAGTRSAVVGVARGGQILAVF